MACLAQHAAGGMQAWVDYCLNVIVNVRFNLFCGLWFDTSKRLTLMNARTKGRAEITFYLPGVIVELSGTWRQIVALFWFQFLIVTYGRYKKNHVGLMWGAVNLTKKPKMMSFITPTVCRDQAAGISVRGKWLFLKPIIDWVNGEELLWWAPRTQRFPLGCDALAAYW